MKPGKISTLKELQLQVPRILEEYADNQELAFIALANPLAALEKIGYSFTPSAREEIEDRIRFGKEGAEKVKQLKETIFTAAGKKFDLGSPVEVKTHLKIILSKQPVSKEKSKISDEGISQTNINAILKIIEEPVKKKDKDVLDPLASYRKDHPIIETLIEYRKMDASHVRLADSMTINQLLAKRENIPLKNIKFRLSRKNK
jgi:DNA polymerase I-like protein with 3'-5' exonuclease and polymerase domains